MGCFNFNNYTPIYVSLKLIIGKKKILMHAIEKVYMILFRIHSHSFGLNKFIYYHRRIFNTTFHRNMQFNVFI